MDGRLRIAKTDMGEKKADSGNATSLWRKNHVSGKFQFCGWDPIQRVCVR